MAQVGLHDRRISVHHSIQGIGYDLAVVTHMACYPNAAKTRNQSAKRKRKIKMLQTVVSLQLQILPSVLNHGSGSIIQSPGLTAVIKPKALNARDFEGERMRAKE